MQSKTESLIESFINILVGFGISLASQLIIFPIFGINHLTLFENAQIVVYFTVISLIRSYCLRRAFNYYEARKTRWR